MFYYFKDRDPLQYKLKLYLNFKLILSIFTKDRRYNIIVYRNIHKIILFLNINALVRNINALVWVRSSSSIPKTSIYAMLNFNITRKEIKKKCNLTLLNIYRYIIVIGLYSDTYITTHTSQRLSLTCTNLNIAMFTKSTPFT